MREEPTGRTNYSAAAREALEVLDGILQEARRYEHAVHVLQFDQETICPQKGMEEQGETLVFMENQAYRLTHSEAYAEALRALKECEEELDSFDRAMVRTRLRELEKESRITPEMQYRYSEIFNRAWVSWQKAKTASDYSIFAPSLTEVRDTEKEIVSLRRMTQEDTAQRGKGQAGEERPGEEKPGEERPGEERLAAANGGGTDYDLLLDDYEEGMTTGTLDEIFGRCRQRLVPFLHRIGQSGRKIRTDFLHRTVTDEQQRAAADYLLRLIGFDLERGAFTTTEHPFTDGLGQNDVRVTTHFYPDQFLSSIYSIIHEGGHALFEQLQPAENFTHWLDGKSMGQHESVSRFYENILGRSRDFIALVYPELKKIFPQVLSDVTEEELYEAVNVVTPSLIRTEADEFTYTLHIMIRYEIEKKIMDGGAPIDSLPQLWNDLYEEYLGVRPQSDREGLLQDVHWTGGFGYFPTYALGNMYNAMYYQRMKKELDLPKLIREGRFDAINGWMADNVFREADRKTPEEWIRGITGRELTPDDFLDYLEEKYSALYELD